MVSLRPSRRSVSPFGFRPEPESEFAGLQTKFASIFGDPAEGEAARLSSWDDAKHFPTFLSAAAEAAANDALNLERLCQFALRHRSELESRDLQLLVFSSMEAVFQRKTEVFLVNAHEENETVPARVLFAKERDLLVGGYFFPVTETTPADFSAFVQRWISSSDTDRLLHFFDFSLGSSNPTFEYYLVFAHPALQRIVGNKPQLRTLWKKVDPLAVKLGGGAWASRVSAALDL